MEVIVFIVTIIAGIGFALFLQWRGEVRYNKRLDEKYSKK